MNRSALTIKMLNYLKANDLVSREELANYLETNIRNISEFKKELEVAGYVIESVSGKYGGYRLMEDSLIPTVSLDDNEIMALNDATKFLKQSGFHQQKQFEEAIMKVKNNIRNPKLSNNIHYLISKSPQGQDSINEELLVGAKKHHCCVDMEYRTLHGDTWEKRRIHPYELIYSDEGNYVLAYDVTANKNHRFKTFKISSMRMRNLQLTEFTFTKDLGFKLSDYIGQQSILSDVHEVALEISGTHAVLLCERDIGLMTDKRVENGKLLLSFKMENKEKIIEFILSLGKDCKVLQPEYIKNEIVERLKQSLAQYML